ncbi:MAG: HAD family hydrolase [Pseudomonadales bacterium]|nr:HAD family hydrolase [Pseudomonadales bacterium]
MTLAIFDLDETLIAGDSDHAWGEFLISKGLVDAARHRSINDQFYEDYKNGNLDVDAYLQFACEFLTRHPPEQLYRWREMFIEEMIRPIVLPQAQALIGFHREQQHRLLIVTATNQFITEPIAHLFGIHELIAPVPELTSTGYTGRITGVPSFGAGKVIRLKSWLQETGETLTGSYFYSDSANDIPLLEEVDHPCAVDPDSRLQATAETRQWRIISLRDQF